MGNTVDSIRERLALSVPPPPDRGSSIFDDTAGVEGSAQHAPPSALEAYRDDSDQDDDDDDAAPANDDAHQSDHQ